MERELAVKTVLISGGSDGLGKAIAKQLAAKYHVVILATNENRLRDVAAEINCEYYVCDVRNYEQVTSTIKKIGSIDYLINNAGIWLQGPLDETDPKRIQETLDTNTLGTIYLTKAVMPVMKVQKAGRIINVISQAGLNARAGWPVYIASKWAITGFTKSMQQELEPFGIGVTGLYPGTINTDMFAKAGVRKDVADALNPKEIAIAIEHILALNDTTSITELGFKKI
jgi:NAD(P)-dependent dehydrogenase (short-subunit alcohol dehydrogenase family)